MAVWLAAVAVLATGAGAGDSSGSGHSVHELQKEIHQQMQRIMVADFVIENAIRNHSAQAQLLNESQHTSEDCKLRYAAAKRSIAESQERVADLQSQLNGTQSQMAESEERRTKLERRVHKAEALEQKAEEEASALKSKADEVLPERQAWVQSGIGLFLNWLKGLPCQNLVALLAALLGAVSCLDSELFILAASLVLVALGVGMTAGQKFFEGWGGESLLLSVLVGGEAALLTAAAAVVGYTGFQLVLGAVLGLLAAQLSAAWAQDWIPAQVPFWYLLFLALGVAATGYGGKRASELLGYAAGGLLVSSSLVFFLAEILSDLTFPRSWADAVNAYVNGVHLKDLGALPLFVRLVGFAAWVAFVALGPSLSVKLKSMVLKEDSESLREPLLGNADTGA